MREPETVVSKPFTRTICALPFVPGAPGEEKVILCMREKEGQKVYDGFGGAVLYPENDPEAERKSCSVYIHSSLDILTRPEDWTQIVTLRSLHWEVTFFYCIAEIFRTARSREADTVISFEDACGALPLNTIFSLRWLVPLVLDDEVIKPLGMSGIRI